MSFEKDCYKSNKIIVPQCKKCKYFNNIDNKVICNKKDNNEIPYSILSNQITCNYKEV